LEEEHAPDEKELAGMPKEDLEEKMVLEDSITSVRREKEAESHGGGLLRDSPR
jgi:hypothetical protein